MSQKPTDAEAAAKRQASDDLNQAVQEWITEDARQRDLGRQMFYVTFQPRYAKTAHPMLGRLIRAGDVLGVVADCFDHAQAWVGHTLNRSFSEIVPARRWAATGIVFDTQEVPTARYFAHPQGKRIVLWENGEMDCWSKEGKRATTSATPDSLLEGHGAWAEEWYTRDGEAVTRMQVIKIGTETGAL